VDEYLRTSDEHIYAIGDAIEVRDYNTGLPMQVALAGPANRQARLVADNISGKKQLYKGTLGTSILKVFDLAVARTGVNEKLLRQLDQDYAAVHIYPASHATYYPGAEPLALKLLFHPTTGALYGAQGIGKAGVDKSIDVLAAAIKGGLTAFDLPDLELAYAPPYSSAKNPVNMLGYVASNIADGTLKAIQYDEIDAVVARGGLLIDVREPSEFTQGCIKGSVNIPLGDLRAHMGELPARQPIYITCQTGLRGYLAARILEEAGCRAINLDGGYKTYSLSKAG
jgi:rhodanese-related sulfurtransferase